MNKHYFFYKTIITIFFFTFLTNAQTVSTLVPGPSTFNDGLALDADGNIYAARYYSSTVTKITPTGETSIFANGFSNPNGITFDKNYDLYVPNASGNIIHKVSLDGVVDTFKQITSPHALIFDDEGNLYVAHYPTSKITKIDTAGNESTFWAGNGLNGPIGLSIDGDRNFYVGNFNDGKIFKRTPSGDITQIGNIPGWMGFMTLSGNAIYATAYQQNKIFKVPTDGSGQSVFAGTGIAGQVDGDVTSATFSNPNGIVATTTGDTLYISDYQTRSLRMITGVNGVTSVGDETNLPAGFLLDQNYPNPFNPSTNIKFSIPAGNENVYSQLKIYDLLGNEVTTLFDEQKPSGTYEVIFDAVSNGNQLSSGIYFYKLTSGRVSVSKKMLLLK